MCNNKFTILGEDVSDIPAEYLFLLNDNSHVYCFDIRNVKEQLKHEHPPKNPYTREPFTNETLGNIITHLNSLNLGEAPKETLTFQELAVKLSTLMTYHSNIQNLIETDFPKFHLFTKKLSDVFDLDLRHQDNHSLKVSVLEQLVEIIQRDPDSKWDITEIYNSVYGRPESPI